MRQRLGAPVLVLLLMQADCASTTEPPLPIVAGSSCGAEAAQYTVSVQQLTALLPAADYLQHARAMPPAEAAAMVAGDIGRLGTAVDQLNTLYAGLKSCRIARANELRASGVSIDRLRAEHKLYTRDLDDVRLHAGVAAAAEAMLREAAGAIEAASPAGRLKAAKALAAPPLPLQPYIAEAAATIYAKPDPTSPVIADIRRGMRASGPGGGPVPGWTTIMLNDGSIGFVQSDFLALAGRNRSAELAASKALAARDETDPFVALAVAAERTLPSKVDSLSSTIETAADAGSTAYGA